jgi:hypothetical protein
VSLLRDLLLSLVGGGGIAMLLFWLTNRRDKQNAREQREEERKGLWRLIDMEIYQNRFKLSMIRDSPDVGLLYDSYAELHIESWYESKSRLAQLLPPEHIEVLVKYYGMIQRLGVSLHDEAFNPPKYLTRRDRRNKNVQRAIAKGIADAIPKKDNLLSVYARDALVYGDEARQFGTTYIGQVPDYFWLYGEEATEED